MIDHRTWVAAGQALSVAVAAPLFAGWVPQCRAWLQGRRAPPLARPWQELVKLWHKESLQPERSTTLWLVTPPLVWGLSAVAALLVPAFTGRPGLTHTGDLLTLVGLFAGVRVLTALAALDAGSALTGLGARREMMLGFLVEPAFVMVVVALGVTLGTTAAGGIAQTLTAHGPAVSPTVWLLAVALVLVLLAENGRIPADSPGGHLELAMVHEACEIETGGPALALLQWAGHLRLLTSVNLVLLLVLPWGPRAEHTLGGFGFALAVWAAKLALVGAGLALIEMLNAKFRIFRLPELLVGAYLLAVLAVLVHGLYLDS